MSRTVCWIALVALVGLGLWSAPASACIPGSCVPIAVSGGGSCLVCVLHPPDVSRAVDSCAQVGECRCISFVCVPPGASASASTDWKSAVLGSERAEPAPPSLPF
jgi:hypothetical protein